MSETTDKSETTGRACAVLTALLVGTCLACEGLRRHCPMPRGGAFLVTVLLHHVVVLAVVGWMWHRYLHWMFHSPWWAAVLVFAIPGALLAPAVVSCALGRSTGGWSEVLLRVVFNHVVLRLYLYLGLYGGGFVRVVVGLGVFLFCVHLFRRSWAVGGWVHRRAQASLRRYLGRQPDGRHYLALRAVHWRVFGRSPWDSQYENVLRELIAGGQALLDRRRLEECAKHLASARTDAPRLLPGDLRRLHDCKTNLARCLTAPAPDAPSPLSRLIEAAVIYHELQLTSPSGERRPSRTRPDRADGRRSARRLELELYEHLLGRGTCQAHPPGESLGAAWDLLLHRYEGGCRFWKRLPSWLRDLLCPDRCPPPDARTQTPTEYQRQVVRFLAEPSDNVDELLRALTGHVSFDADTRTLIWLAMDKWMTRVAATPGCWHETLIDGYVRLRREGLPVEFWGVEVPFEVVRADHHWLQRQCSTRLGVAWLNYRHALGRIPGGGVCRTFARDQGVSNLAAGETAALQLLTTGLEDDAHAN